MDTVERHNTSYVYKEILQTHEFPEFDKIAKNNGCSVAFMHKISNKFMFSVIIRI